MRYSLGTWAALSLCGGGASAFGVPRRHHRVTSALRADYLSSLSTTPVGTASSPTPVATAAPATPPKATAATPPLPPLNLMMPPPGPSPAEMAEEMAAANVVRFAHAPLDYFGVALMTPKGPRPKADVGTPHDATRPLADAGPLSVGTWWCAAGGWPSETPRATTEVFHVFSGRGCVTDSDGKTKHYFGPGDTVVLPKGWAGRWDIWKDLHKVWFVHEHARVEVKVAKGECIQAAVTPYRGLVAPGLAMPGLTGVEHQLYSLGPTNVMGWTCPAPSKIDVDMPLFHTEAFHMLEGVVFVSNADGSAQRCVAGDTVVLPRGWCGRLDVMETVRKLRVVVE